MGLCVCVRVSVGRLTMVKRSVTQTVVNQLVGEYNKADGSAVVVVDV